MTVPSEPGTTDRPLRRDALRNLERIRAGALAVFAAHGLDASHELIAREADVSVGTVYRRFPDKEELIDSLFEHELDAVVAGAEAALDEADPWDGVVRLFTAGLERAAANVGLLQLITGSRHGAAKVERARDRLRPLSEQVIERARAAGVVRPEACPQDVPVTMLMLAPLIDAGRGTAPELWRRHLALVLDGLRADGGAREPLPPTVPEDVVAEVMVAAQRPRTPGPARAV